MMLEIVITSSVLIIIVLAVRFALRRKLSPTVTYAMWAIVALRLLLPVSMAETQVSVMNLFPQESLTEQSESVQPAPTFTVPDSEPEEIQPMPPVPQERPDDTVAAEEESSAITPQPAPPSGEKENVSARDVLLTIWLTGAGIMLACAIGRNLGFYLKIRAVRRPFAAEGAPVPVYIADGIASPCLFGVFRPAVYLNSFAAEDERRGEYIIAHELTHYRHFDHVWAVVRVLCCAVYWFNPLVWLAAYLSRQDGELACDHAVIGRLGEERRFDYGRTLIDMITVRFAPAGALLASTTMSSGAKSVKERISMIRVKPRTILWAAVTVCAVIAVAVVITFTGASAKEQESDPVGLIDPAETLVVHLFAPNEMTPIEQYVLEDGSDIQKVLDSLHSGRWEEVDIAQITEQSNLVIRLSINYFEYFEITADGYAVWKYIGEKANSAEVISLDGANILTKGDVPEGFYGFYKLPDGVLDGIMQSVSDVVALWNRAGELAYGKTAGELVGELIRSGSCRMDYMNIQIPLTDAVDIDSVLFNIGSYNIDSLNVFDSGTLPEDTVIGETVRFVQTDPSAPTADVTMQIDIAQGATWMTVCAGEERVELEMVNTSALWSLMHEFVPAHISVGKEYTGLGIMDTLFSSDIAVYCDSLGCDSKIAYGSEAFEEIWSQFDDYDEYGIWDDTTDEVWLNPDFQQNGYMVIQSANGYLPSDCVMTIYYNYGYVKYTFKGSDTWFKVRTVLDTRCYAIAAACSVPPGESLPECEYDRLSYELSRPDAADSGTLYDKVVINQMLELLDTGKYELVEEINGDFDGGFDSDFTPGRPWVRFRFSAVNNLEYYVKPDGAMYVCLFYNEGERYADALADYYANLAVYEADMDYYNSNGYFGPSKAIDVVCSAWLYRASPELYESLETLVHTLPRV